MNGARVVVLGLLFSCGPAPATAPARQVEPPPPGPRALANFPGDRVSRIACDAERVLIWLSDGPRGGTFYEVSLRDGARKTIGPTTDSLAALTISGDDAFAITVDVPPPSTRVGKGQLLAISHGRIASVGEAFTASASSRIAVDDRHIVWTSPIVDKKSSLIVANRATPETRTEIPLELDGNLSLLGDHALAFSFGGSSTVDLVHGTASFRLSTDYADAAVLGTSVYALARVEGHDNSWKLVETTAKPAPRVVVEVAPPVTALSRSSMLFVGEQVCVDEEDFVTGGWAPGLWCAPRSGGPLHMVLPLAADKPFTMNLGCGNVIVRQESRRTGTTLSTSAVL